MTIGYVVGFSKSPGNKQDWTPDKRVATSRFRLEKEILDWSKPKVEQKPMRKSHSTGALKALKRTIKDPSDLPILSAKPPRRGGGKNRAVARRDGKANEPEARQRQKKDRVIIVNFRLPLKLTKNEAGKWIVKWNNLSDVIANFRYLEDKYTFTWVGWPGVDASSSDEWDEIENVLARHNCVPVKLDKTVRENFYRGYCKSILWPLFHYQISRSDNQLKRHDVLWQAYSAVNILFAKKAALVSEFETDAMVWFHNYHLLLAPTFMRRTNPNAKIGLFIHTTFPTSEVFRCLPARTNLMRGIISADIIGFHTYDYARHFISSSKRLLNLEFETLEGGSLGVLYNGRRVELQVNHIGIESTQICKLAASSIVKEEAQKLREQYKGIKVILSIDELDVIKGTLLKLVAYRQFLALHTEWKGEMVFLQVLKPSSNKQHQQDCRKTIMAEIESIREEFGKDVIEVLEESPSLERFLAFCQVADVAVFSTFWDGFNTGPHEFTAAQHNRTDPGMLIVSEFMGCSRSLSGAIRVNPWKTSEVARAIHTGLVLGVEEKRVAHQRRYNYVKRYDFKTWVNCFITDLKKHSALSENKVCLPLGWGSNVRLIYLPNDYLALKDHETKLLSAYTRAKKRLLLFDYGGTLRSNKSAFDKRSDPRSVKPTKGGVPPEVLSYLAKISSDPANWVAVISGHSRKDIGEAFEGLDDVCLFAEKGAFIRWPRAKGFVRSPDVGEAAFKKVTRDLMSKYLQKTDGVEVIEKETALVWSYENTDPIYGEMQAGELEKYLQRLLKPYPARVTRYEHARIIEVAPEICNKYDATLRIIKRFKLELEKDGVESSDTFLMACGDDRSDEAMFEVIEKVGKRWCPTQHFTCSVGIKPSKAHYYVADAFEVQEVLRLLSGGTG